MICSLRNTAIQHSFSFSHSPISILKMTKNQAAAMVCIAIRAMSTILILISVTNKIEDKDRVIISTLLACLLITYLDTMGGKRGTQDVTSLQLLS